MVDRYKSDLNQIRPEESYKWRALACFQDNWDPEAPDFAEMLNRSLADAGNLLIGAMYYPANMLREAASINPEGVKQSLLRLFDEDSGDLRERMERFAKEMDAENDRNHAEDIAAGRSIHSFQDPHAMSVYLFFAHPDKYYLYKSSMCAEFAKLVDAQKAKNKYDKVVMYNNLLDALLAWVKENRQDVIEASDALLHSFLKDVDVDHHLLMQDIVYYATNHMADGSGNGATVIGDDPRAEGVRYWIVSPGAEASRWDEFYSEGVVGIGWSRIGSVEQFDTRDKLRAALVEAFPGEGTHRDSSLALWQFCHEMKPGDVIFAKKGRKEVIGRGIIADDYEFDEDRGNGYKNLRKVDWTHKGTWAYPGVAPMKTLTGMTPYTEIVQKLEALFEIEEMPEVPSENLPSYSKEDFLEEVYLTEHEYDRLSSLLRVKKNIILQGAPGVGKTFMAKRLAYSIMGCKDPERVKLVQFHQSYSYEDFIMGYRPSQDGFELKTGAFYDFCKRAADDPDNDYFFVIDEINRGNLSKIFGELFMLVEPDKRGVSLQLLYANEQFSVPANLYLMGMMNTADRSLAMMDYALRRRFAFYEIAPAFDSDGFIVYRDKLGSDKFDRLVNTVVRLNDAIASDDSLGRGFRIGHSYFCGIRQATDDRLAQIVDFELVPLLEEYWFDEPAKVSDWTARLKGALR